MLNIPTKIHCPDRLFLKDGLFGPGPTLTIGVITVRKFGTIPRVGLVQKRLHNAKLPSGDAIRCMRLFCQSPHA